MKILTSCLLAFLIGAVSAGAAQPGQPPYIHQQFATTNDAVTVTNIIQSLATGGQATNIILGPTGQINKLANSTAAVILPASIGPTNMALQSIDKTNIVNNTITSNQVASANLDLIDIRPFSSAYLAAEVNDETGSGSLVFGTSPTLSGPVVSSSTASTFAGFDGSKTLGSASLPSSALASALTDENGSGPVLFSTGDGGGLTKLNLLNGTNWPAVSLVGNPTGASANTVPIPLDSTLSFVAGALHAVGGGGGGTVGTTNTTLYITVTGQITFQGTNGTVLGTWTNGNLVINTNVFVGANLQALQLIASNLTSSLTVTPQGSNVLLSFVTTNSVGTAQTTTIKVGSTAFLLEDANTNGVDVFTYTEDGIFSFGTNSATRVTVNGNNSTIGMMYNGTTNNAWPVIDARAFGLSTNGDQTANIQAAITVATNLHQRVFVPAGHYIINGQLTVKNVFLEGESPSSQSGGGTIFDCVAGVNNMIFVPAGSAGTVIRNISFIGNVAAGGGTGITTSTNAASDTTDLTIEGCTFYHLARAVYLNRANVIDFQDNFFNDCTTGIWGTNNANAVRIEGGHFFDVTCIRVDDNTCINWTVLASRFENSSNAISAIGVQLFNSIGNYFEANTNDFVMNGVNNANFAYNNAGTTFLTTNILFTGVHGGQIWGNSFGASTPTFNVDNTSFDVLVGNDSFNNPPSYKFNPITGFIYDGTNVTYFGGGIYSSNGNANYTILTNVAAGVLGSTANGNTAVVLPVTGGLSILGGNLTDANATNGGFILNTYARSNVVDQIQTWPTSTNSIVAQPGSTSWLLQSATPTAQTNISGTLSATAWVFQSLVVSNSTAAAFTNWITIPGAVAEGYSATNDFAVLGGNMTVIPAGKYKEIFFKLRLGQTNYAIINP